MEYCGSDESVVSSGAGAMACSAATEPLLAFDEPPAIGRTATSRSPSGEETTNSDGPPRTRSTGKSEARPDHANGFPDAS